jgi:hypothetical protein
MHCPDDHLKNMYNHAKVRRHLEKHHKNIPWTEEAYQKKVDGYDICIHPHGIALTVSFSENRLVDDWLEDMGEGAARPRSKRETIRKHSSRKDHEEFDPAVWREKFIKVLVKKNWPLNIAEDPDFVDLQLYANKEIPLPMGPKAVEGEMTRQMDRVKLETIKEIYEYKTGQGVGRGVVNMTIDGWTSPNDIHFLSITGHWINHQEQQCKRLLGFEVLDKDPTAEMIHETVMAVAAEFGFADAMGFFENLRVRLLC